jgi:hypothetical protein
LLPPSIDGEESSSDKNGKREEKFSIEAREGNIFKTSPPTLSNLIISTLTDTFNSRTSIT